MRSACELRPGENLRRPSQAVYSPHSNASEHKRGSRTWRAVSARRFWLQRNIKPDIGPIRRGRRSSASFAIHDISGIPGSPMDRVGEFGSWRDPGGDPSLSRSIFGRILRVRENSSPLRLRRDLTIRDRSHACEPGHVADLVTTAVQGPRAARSGGWEISSGRANHKGHH